jgi:hypothetical protein
MTDMADMLVAQLKLQRESFGKDPTRMLPEERMEFLRWNVLALIDELMEMLQETGWKPWASSNHVDHAAAMKEMVDAWHFFMNIMLTVSGVDVASTSDGQMDMEALAQWFADRYMEKRNVNADRQAEGYTGLDKCPICKRDRKTTSRFDPITDSSDAVEYCPCGYVYQDGAT